MRNIGLMMCVLALGCGDSQGGNGGAGGDPNNCTDDTCRDPMLCQGVDCNDGNECTDDTCDPQTGVCMNANVADEATCDFEGLPGLCNAGLCEDAALCLDVVCNDGNECTDDACDLQIGACVNENVADEATCDFEGLPGLCNEGLCEDAALCLDVVCDDDNECTDDACDPETGTCKHPNASGGKTCDFDGLPGLCMAGLCEDAGLCVEVDCGDDNECTDDTCDPENGLCGNPNLTDGTACNDGSGTCTGGTCVTPVDPEAQITTQVMSCSLLGNTAMIPVDLTVDPDTEFSPGGSSTVSTVLTFTIPAGIGDFLISVLNRDDATVTAASLDVSVDGGTPTPLVLSRSDLPLVVDVDADDDGFAEDLDFSTDVDTTEIANDGSPAVGFEVTGFSVTLNVGVNLTLSTDDACALGLPETAISFPAN